MGNLSFVLRTFALQLTLPSKPLYLSLKVLYALDGLFVLKGYWKFKSP